MNKTFTDIAVVEISRFFVPLQRLDSPKNITAFINELGWQFEEGIEIDISFTDLISSVNDLIGTVLSVVQSNDDSSRATLIVQAFGQVKDLIVEVKENVPAIETAIKNVPDFIGETGDLAPLLITRLFDYLLYVYLQRYHRQIFAVLHIIGIVEIVNDSKGQPIKTIQWARVPLLFTNPKAIGNQVYNWDNEQIFKGQELLARMEVLLKAFNLPGGLYIQSDDIRAHFQRTEASDNQELRIPLYQGGIWQDGTSPYTELSLNVFPIPALTAPTPEKAGLGLYPYLLGNSAQEFDLTETWKLKFIVQMDIEGGLGIMIRPPSKLHVDKGLFETADEFLDAHFEIGIISKAPKNELTYLFGDDDGSYLGYGEIGFNLILALDNGKEELVAEMLINGLSLKIDMSKGDGFLQKILAGVVIESVTDLVLGISNLDGFYFRGSGGLEIEIPLHKSLGPITFQSLYIRFTISDKMELQFATSLGFKLGPVSGSVEKIGLGIPLSINSQNNGNLGPIDVQSPVFVPPIGAGLAIDAGGIAGGGYVRFDDENKQYAGILQLNFGELGLVAIGLITTRMPDGSTGFSMVINIGVIFSPPIQLSFGFTLSGVGGLLGINRTMMTDVLRDGLRNRTLNSILFPEDPILNAQKIICDMQSVFPPTDGRFIIGPMVKIGWGSPNIITADVGIFIELPSPVRIALLGQIVALLPSQDDAIVELHIDVLGIIEFEKKELSIDATIYDSRILVYTLTGDAAVRWNWGDYPVLAMSLGGFHPRFSPPPAFPSLRRLTLNLSQGDTFQLFCSVYQALTSNSLQFGAALGIYAKEGGASVEGNLSFDALFYFSPFSFAVDINGNVVAKYKGHELAGVYISLGLSGPTPWHAQGEASFEILAWDVSVGFSKTWGQSETQTLPAVDPWVGSSSGGGLREALERKESWSAALPAGMRVVESVRSLESGADDLIVLHPTGALEIRQKVLPLGIQIQKLGNSPVTGHHTFWVDSICAGQNQKPPMTHVPIEDDFARGQYENLTEQQKLSLPSFEKMTGGVSAHFEDILLSSQQIEDLALEYESILINDNRTSQPAGKGTGKVQWDVAKRQLRGNAANASRLRKTGHAKYEILGKTAKVRVDKEGYCLVKTSDMSLIETPGNDGTLTRMKADQAMKAYLNSYPDKAGEVQVVPSYEVPEPVAV